MSEKLKNILMLFVLIYGSILVSSDGRNKGDDIGKGGRSGGAGCLDGHRASPGVSVCRVSSPLSNNPFLCTAAFEQTASQLWDRHIRLLAAAVAMPGCFMPIAIPESVRAGTPKPVTPSCETQNRP